MLELKNVSIESDNKEILKDVNLLFTPGVHFITGPNGAGKSTLVHAIMGSPSYKVSGSIKHKGHEIVDTPTHIRAQEGIFLGFQTPTPIQGLSNFQLIRNVVIPNSKTASISTSLSAFRGLCDELNLPEGWDKLEVNVAASGGEKKKNELLQMIMFDPSVAMLDEPDSGLDIDSINILIDTLSKFLKKENKCLIIVSHYEKLLTSLTPTTVTVVANNTASQFTDVSVIQDILKNGFKKYQTV